MRSKLLRASLEVSSDRATVSTSPSSMAQKKESEPSGFTFWIERA